MPDPATTRRVPRCPRWTPPVLAALLCLPLTILAPSAFAAPPGLPGMDVSGHQAEVDWRAASAAGVRFAYVKATEGTDFRNPAFGGQYAGSADADLARGAYHFALPDRSSGAQQANFFADHGGGPKGRTLPGAVDMETNPYGESCYGMDPVALSWWLVDFSDTYFARTGRHPVIYTTTEWWNRCTGANPGFAANSPLWIARYGPEAGPLPAGWHYYSFWQHSDRGPVPGGQDTFNGGPKQLARMLD